MHIQEITTMFRQANWLPPQLPFKGAHFLQDDIAAFDPAVSSPFSLLQSMLGLPLTSSKFFSMTSEEIRALDPQQRILLETSFEAIQSGMCSF